MRIAFLIVIILHGLIHVLGFVKGLGIKEVKELTLPISKPMGMLWLAAAILLLVYGILFYWNHKYAWLFGLVAVAVSQFLIILYWKDARFGTLPNVAILLVAIFSFGHYNFQKLVRFETSTLLDQSKISTDRIISENDIMDLPNPVQKWLRHSRVMGKPFIYAGRVTQRAEMQLKPGQDNWLQATAVQYSTVDIPAFIWTVDMKMNRLMHFLGRDKFVDGKGEMVIKMNALINLANEKGGKMDEGSLQRYLGEMVWFPSLAISPYITWQEADENSAMATMDYKGTKGSGTFYFNSEGDFVKFSAMRFRGNEPDAERQEWVLLVEEHRTFDGIKVPSKMTATWKLEEGDWTWLKLEIVDIKYNEDATR